MAEWYIDRDLIEWHGCDFEDASCENRDCSGCSHAEVSHAQVMQIPIADVVERKEINKALNEAYKIRNEVLYDNGSYEPNDVLDIIDQITKSFEEL